MSYDFPILQVFEAVGGRVRQHRFNGWAAAYCPIHEDANASAQVNEERGRVRCLVCAFNTDAIGLVQLAEGLKFKEALARVREITGGDGAGVPGGAPRRDGSLLPRVPGRTGDRRDRRAYKPPWKRDRG